MNTEDSMSLFYQPSPEKRRTKEFPPIKMPPHSSEYEKKQLKKSIIKEQVKVFLLTFLAAATICMWRQFWALSKNVISN